MKRTAAVMAKLRATDLNAQVSLRITDNPEDDSLYVPISLIKKCSTI